MRRARRPRRCASRRTTSRTEFVTSSDETRSVVDAWPCALVVTAVLSSEPTSVLNWTVFPARGWPLRFPTNAVMPARWPGEIEFGLTATWILISAEVLANPVVGAGLPTHWERTFTPPFCSWHSNRGPVVPLLSEHAWISV